MNRSLEQGRRATHTSQLRTYLIESKSIYTGKLKSKLVIKKVQRVSSDTKRSSPDSI